MNTKFLTQNPQGPDQMNIKWSDTKERRAAWAWRPRAVPLVKELRTRDFEFLIADGRPFDCIRFYG